MLPIRSNPLERFFTSCNRHKYTVATSGCTYDAKIARNAKAHIALQDLCLDIVDACDS